ncbi:glycosyltransferase [archaeon]|jgi:glycosyltransferase involved in cell wall biosynthesis|nr:glycosyltransferase [archaeon]
MKKILIVGIKEYPLGSSNGEDKRSLGGIEYGLSRIIYGLKSEFNLTIITRKFLNTPSLEKNKQLKIIRLKWIKGFLRGVSYNANTFFYLLFKKIDFDVVITSGLFSTFFIGFLKLIRFKKFKILCRWDTPLYLLNSKIYFPLEFVTYNYLIDYFVLKDIFEVERVKRLYFIKKNIFLIGGFGVKNNLDLNKNKIFKRNNLSAIFIGRLIDQKNILLTIDVFKELNKLIKIELKIFGEGPLKEKIINYINQNNLTFIKYMGYTKNSLKEINNASFLILLSKTEGLPNVALEAMSCKTPIFISSIGLFNKDIVNLIDISQSDYKIALNIHSMILDKEKMILKANRAYKYYKKYYNYNNMIANYKKIIKSI